MKLFLTSIFSTVSLGLCFGQFFPSYPGFTDFIKKNKIKSVSIIDTSIDIGHVKRIERRKLSFDTRGNITSEASCNCDTIEFTHEYDVAGNEVLCKRANGKIYSISKNIYDKKGHLLKTMEKAAPGETIDNDSVQKYYQYYKDGKLFKDTWIFYENKYADTDITSTYYYNSEGKLRLMVLGTDSVSNKWAFHLYYDTKGLLIKTISSNQTESFEYDEKGNLILWGDGRKDIYFKYEYY